MLQSFDVRLNADKTALRNQMLAGVPGFLCDGERDGPTRTGRTRTAVSSRNYIEVSKDQIKLKHAEKSKTAAEKLKKHLALIKKF